MVTYSERAAEVVAKVTAPATATAAATAMADALRDVAARYMAGLAMSGTGSAVVIRPATGAAGEAIVRTGGAYALADRGRGSVVRAYAGGGVLWALVGRRSALSTPWGPKANVAGSTWPGFGITAAAQGDVFEAGKQAFRDAVGITST